MNLRIAICDDEQYTLNSEHDIISSVLQEENIDNTITLFNSPEKLLDSEMIYDIVFLDIEMGEFNGIKVAEAIRDFNKECFIFFVTNHEAYLDEAFNQHAFRFWIKPLERHKLIYGIESVLKELNETDNYIIVTNNLKEIKVYVQNIIYVYAHNNKVYIVTTKGEIEATDTYRDVHEKLKKYDYFCESQRAHFINFKYVKNYNKDRVFCAYRDKIYEVYFSRRKYDNFNKSFLEWIGGK